MILATLEAWEYEHANSVGIRRFTANWTKQDAKHYDRERMEDDRSAQVAAAVCELAVAKHTNRYWHGHVWHHTEHNRYRKLPDVGENIEVRRVRTGSRVALRESQVGKGLFIYAAKAIPAEYRQVELYGWLPYDEAWQQAETVSHMPDSSRVIDITKLNPPERNSK